MPRAFIACMILFAWHLAPCQALATHFAIDLTVKAGKGTKTVHADTAAVGVKPKTRLVLEAKAGDEITVNWTIENADPTKKIYKDVLVHFFTVKEEKVGQTTVPKLNRDVAAESALTMDFKHKDRTDGEISFTLPRPGAYLIRLETIGAAVGKDGHEHFAAIDLVIR